MPCQPRWIERPCSGDWFTRINSKEVVLECSEHGKIGGLTVDEAGGGNTISVRSQLWAKWLEHEQYQLRQQQISAMPHSDYEAWCAPAFNSVNTEVPPVPDQDWIAEQERIRRDIEERQRQERIGRERMELSRRREEEESREREARARRAIFGEMFNGSPYFNPPPPTFPNGPIPMSGFGEPDRLGIMAAVGSIYTNRNDPGSIWLMTQAGWKLAPSGYVSMIDQPAPQPKPEPKKEEPPKAPWERKIIL